MAAPPLWTGMCLLACFVLFLAGCQYRTAQPRAASDCATLAQRMDLAHEIDTLNLLADAFSRRCDDVVIVHGAHARAAYRHKTYSLVKETTGIFLPDGALTSYVLESYERGYLTILLANSYRRTQKPDAAKVELRRLDQELFAPLYNYGEDPANLLLSAVLWEQLGEPGEARVDWLRLRDQVGALHGLDPDIRAFAERQLTRIDHGKTAHPVWRIYGVGAFPDIDWDLQLTGSSTGYVRVRPKTAFPAACASDRGAHLPTRRWFDKIAVRHSHAYHPLLNVQSWIRLPLGIVYSLVPMATGAGLAIGGCAADAAGKGAGQLCELSIRGGIALMQQAPTVLKSALAPDFRHWERVPSSFVVTQAASLQEEPCARDLSDTELAQAVAF